MRILKTTLLSAILICTSIVTSAVFAEDEAKGDDKFQLDAITCWEVLTVPEEDTAYALLLLYGYNAGMQGQLAQTGNMIKDYIAAAGAVCASNPDMSALKAFETKAK